MTSLTYKGTVSGLEDYLHSVTMRMTTSMEYRDDPEEYGKLDRVIEKERELEMFYTMHQADNMEPSL